MGKRKSKARVMKKEKATVGTVFDCLFCNHKQTVECKMSVAMPPQRDADATRADTTRMLPLELNGSAPQQRHR